MEKIRFAFHVHTSASNDSLSSPKRIVEFCRKNGIGAIAICDHNEIKGAKEVERIAAGDPFVIICEEIKTKEGEVIGLFLKDKIEQGLSFRETIAEIKKQGGLVCLPHPGDSIRRSALSKEIAEEAAQETDIVEVFNCRTILAKDNVWAGDFAKKHRLPVVAGSDAHFLQEIPRGLNVIDGFDSKETLLTSLKKARVDKEQKRTGLFLQILSKKISILRKTGPFWLYLILALFFCQSLIFSAGVPFKYDWNWPLFTLDTFSKEALLPPSGLMSVFGKTGLFLLGLFSFLKIPPSVLFAIFIVAVHLGAGAGFYLFINKITKNRLIGMAAGVAYAFSPYIFIRTIVGFTWSLLAYAAAPFFLYLLIKEDKKWWYYLLMGGLLAVIFSQLQAGLLVTLFLAVYFAVEMLTEKGRAETLQKYLYIAGSFLLFELPWIIYSFFNKSDLSVVAGGTATTLSFIASLPHSLRNVLLLSDHIVTRDYFYPLAREPLYLFWYLVFLATGLLSVFNKKTRCLSIALLISGALVLPFSIGPSGLFTGFYTFVFNRFPLIAVFRETYHFQFLLAIIEVALFAFGLDFLWGKLKNMQLNKLIKSAIFATSLIPVFFIIMPYLTLNYAGYLEPRKIPQHYNQLNEYLKENNNLCQKIFYTPGFDFIYFKEDRSPDAANADMIAKSIGRPYLNGGTSVLNVPTEEMYAQNEIISQFYERGDNGEFAALLAEAGIDCLIVREDLDTKYWQASNMIKEESQSTLSKWQRNDWLAMALGKKGFIKKKQFGKDVFIFKVDGQLPVVSRDKRIEAFPSSYQRQTTDYLPITDWATEYAYYKDGWSRGRYDFWRKHLFTQLRQDFLYTDMPGSIVGGKIEQTGRYRLWVRHLVGPMAGEFELNIQYSRFKIQAKATEERFVWKELGEVALNGHESLEIKNLAGENAIADIVLIKQESD